MTTTVGPTQRNADNRAGLHSGPSHRLARCVQISMTAREHRFPHQRPDIRLQPIPTGSTSISLLRRGRSPYTRLGLSRSTCPTMSAEVDDPRHRTPKDERRNQLKEKTIQANGRSIRVWSRRVVVAKSGVNDLESPIVEANGRIEIGTERGRVLVIHGINENRAAEYGCYSDKQRYPENKADDAPYR